MKQNQPPFHHKHFQILSTSYRRGGLLQVRQPDVRGLPPGGQLHQLEVRYRWPASRAPVSVHLVPEHRDRQGQQSFNDNGTVKGLL